MIKDALREAEERMKGAIQALEDESEDVRKVAAMALGEIGDARAVEPLTKALKDKKRDVRKAAKEALKRIKAQKG